MTKNCKLTNQQILLLLKENKERAFTYLYEQFAAALYGVIRREIKNEQLSKEILIRSFINMFSESNKIDCIKPSFFTWMLLLAKKTAAEEFKVEINYRPLEQLNTGNEALGVTTIPTYAALHKIA